MKHSKSHTIYWMQQGKLFTQHGRKEWCCRFKHRGRRGFFCLDTPNREAAAAKAAERYRYVVEHGWDAAQKNQKYRTQSRDPEPVLLTVGKWISHVREIAIVTPLTLASYEQALRRIAAGAVLEIEHKGNDHETWRKAVDDVALTELTGHAIGKWVKRRLGGAKGDPSAEEQARHTVNHVLRSAKSMFSTKKILPLISAQTRDLLPNPMPLSDVRLMEEDSSARFTPSVDPETLLVKARDELGTPRQRGETERSFLVREQLWIAFLLSFCAGLRRKESDLLTWWQVHLGEPVRAHIELGVTRYFRPKNKAHGKPIPLEPEVAAILIAYRSGHQHDEFVLSSHRTPDQARLGRPRCHETWRALNIWLKAHGIDDRKPVHALRKSMGALMARRHGIHAAQRLLRHTTPVITSKYYSDSEARETPGIGGLLKKSARQ